MISQTEASPLSPQYSLGESDSNAANDQNETKSPRLLRVTKPSSSLSFSSPDSEEKIVSSDDHLSDDDQEIAEIVRFLKDLDQKEKEERQHHRKSCDASKSSLNYSEASTEGSPHAGRGILEGTTLTDNSTVGEHSSLSGESWTTASRSDGPKHAMPDGDAPVEEIEEEESNPSSTTPTKGNLRTTTYVDDTIHDASNLLIPPFVLRPRTSYGSCSDYSSNSVSTPVPSRPTFLCNNSLEEEEKDESPLKFHHCRKTEFTGSPKRRSHQNVVHDIVDDVPATSQSAVVIHTEYGDIAPEKEEPEQAASASQEYSSSSSSRWICGLDLEDWTNAQSDLRLYFCF